jgi:hypothetical protein
VIPKRSTKLKSGYDKVFTVLEYCDGPRKGIAGCAARPHFFECLTNEENGYSDQYLLTPISNATFRLAMEASEIWRKWELIFLSGRRSGTSSRDYLQDTQRYRKLNRVLKKRLVTVSRNAVARTGEFEALGRPKLPKGAMRPLQVKWKQ